METGITIFLFLFFCVGFFMVSKIFMPEFLDEAYDKGGILSGIIGAICGLTMIGCFKWLYKKLKVKSKLRGNFEGYRLPKTKD
jgi:ABC-type antimicrobial peptide transport system permease subunit